MKKSLSLFAILVFSLQLFAWAPPSYVVTPQLPGATLRVVGANTRNYLYDFTADNADCKDMDCFNRKTENMAKVFVYLQADIVALCEIQQDNEILGYLVQAMNKEYGENVYDFVMDNSKYSKSGSNYGYI